jgi:hypothetical protein
MKKLFLILLLVLMLRVPTGIWLTLTNQDKLNFIQQVAGMYCLEAKCVGNEVSLSVERNEEFVYFKFECGVKDDGRAKKSDA